jgi:hypothetical protein
VPVPLSLAFCAHCAAELGWVSVSSLRLHLLFSLALATCGNSHLHALSHPRSQPPRRRATDGRTVPPAMGNCCSDEVSHAGAHPVGSATAKAASAASAAADRFLRSRGAGASTQIEVGSPQHPLGTRRGRQLAAARAPALCRALATAQSRSRRVLSFCLFADRCCGFFGVRRGHTGVAVTSWFVIGAM